MMIGDDHGSHDSTTASLLFGFIRTGLTIIHVLMRSRTITGIAACCASCSLFTIEPAAAYSARVEHEPDEEVDERERRSSRG